MQNSSDGFSQHLRNSCLKQFLSTALKFGLKLVVVHLNCKFSAFFSTSNISHIQSDREKTFYSRVVSRFTTWINFLTMKQFSKIFFVVVHKGYIVSRFNLNSFFGFDVESLWKSNNSSLIRHIWSHFQTYLYKMLHFQSVHCTTFHF